MNLVLTFLFFVFVIVNGCMHFSAITDDRLSDRVVACGAGFSERLAAALADSVKKLPPTGKLSASASEEIESVIFEEIPEGDRLKAYEDYIKCIEDT